MDFLERYSLRHQSARSYWLLSGFYKQMEREQDALTALEKALELAPDFVPARVDLAVYLARADRLERAESEFRRALEQNPYYPKASYNYGAFLVENDRMSESERYFRRALELAPGYSQGTSGHDYGPVVDREIAKKALACIAGAQADRHPNSPGNRNGGRIWCLVHPAC